MPVFFNGRLHITPAVMSLVDDTAMANRNLAVGNVLAVIGRSEGGKPNKALRFSSPSAARKTLRSGDLLTAVEKAFAPSRQTNGPSTVVALRVNPATQSTLALKDAGAVEVISLKSTDFGQYTSQIKVKVESGTNKGKKLTTQFGNDFFATDDVFRDAFSVQYSGAQATAVMTITGTTVTLEAPATTVVASIDLSIYDTIQELVDRVNVVPGFVATVLDGNGEKPALNGLDYVTNQNVKTALYTATATLQAVVGWFNGFGEGFVTATRGAGAGTVPANIPFTFLASGSDGVVTNTEWSNAFTALQNEDVQWVVPLSSDASIHAMADTHATFMSNQGKKERRVFVGGADGQTVDAVIAAAKQLNSDRTAQCYPGFYDFDAAGKLVLYPPYMTAALVGGGFAGSNPGAAMTNKAFSVRGLEVDLVNPTDTDRLIEGGVLCLDETPGGYKVVKSISTWLVNDNFNRVEVSTGFATDFVARNVRNALEVMVGKKASPQALEEAISITDSVLRELARPEPAGPGVIVGNEESPAYKNITASIEGDVLRVEFQCSPVIPINFIPIVIHAVPFVGSASA